MSSIDDNIDRDIFLGVVSKKKELYQVGGIIVKKGTFEEINRFQYYIGQRSKDIELLSKSMQADIEYYLNNKKLLVAISRLVEGHRFYIWDLTLLSNINNINALFKVLSCAIVIKGLLYDSKLILDQQNILSLSNVLSRLGLTLKNDQVAVGEAENLLNLVRYMHEQKISLNL